MQKHLASLGILILRLVLGSLMVGHGAQKLFGWFGGGGLAGAEAMVRSLGLRPAWFWAIVAGVAEFGGGLLFALGLLNPIGSLGITASMLMAITKVHWPKVWVSQGGFEYPLVNVAATTAVALTGPGKYSLDRALGIRLPLPASYLIGLAAVLAGYATALVVAARPAAPAEAPPRAA